MAIKNHSFATTALYQFLASQASQKFITENIPLQEKIAGLITSNKIEIFGSANVLRIVPKNAEAFCPLLNLPAGQKIVASDEVLQIKIAKMIISGGAKFDSENGSLPLQVGSTYGNSKKALQDAMESKMLECSCVQEIDELKDKWYHAIQGKGMQALPIATTLKIKHNTPGLSVLYVLMSALGDMVMYDNIEAFNIDFIEIVDQILVEASEALDQETISFANKQLLELGLKDGFKRSDLGFDDKVDLAKKMLVLVCALLEKDYNDEVGLLECSPCLMAKVGYEKASIPNKRELIDGTKQCLKDLARVEYKAEAVHIIKRMVAILTLGLWSIFQPLWLQGVFTKKIKDARQEASKIRIQKMFIGNML
jgi:hypothetical protein